MTANLSDTSIVVEEAQLRLLREKSSAQRAMLAIRLSSEVVRAAKRAIARVDPSLSARQVELRFVELHYGQVLAEAVRQYVGEPQDER
ncbi:MAG: hypothetical protein WD851_12035 [Pirellulales bacterium]